MIGERLEVGPNWERPGVRTLKVRRDVQAGVITMSDSLALPIRLPVVGHFWRKEGARHCVGGPEIWIPKVKRYVLAGG